MGPVIRFLFTMLMMAVAPAAALAGGLNAGLTDITIKDPETGREVQALVWYPTKAKAKPIQRGPFQLVVAANAPAAPGPHPLILFSHGNGGSPLSHRDSGQALAEAGFIVAAPFHAGDNFRDRSLLGTETLLKSRPRTISALLDAVLADGRFQADRSRIGFFGFSAGGYTGLALSGARPSLAQMAVHCASHPDDSFCRYAPNTNKAPVPLDGLADPRFRAAAILAPVASFFRDEELERIETPILLMQAEHDQQLTARYHADRVAAMVPGVKENWTLAGSHHFSFLAPFPKAIRAELGEIARDNPGFDRAAAHREINSRAITFLKQYLD